MRISHSNPRPGPWFMSPQQGIRTMSKTVLIRGVISDDGRCVTVAPGVEVAARSVEIVTDVPALGVEHTFMLALFFASAEDCKEFRNGEERLVAL